MPLPKKRQLSDLKAGEQKVTDINKVRARKVFSDFLVKNPNAILDKEDHDIAHGNTEYEPGRPYPFPTWL